MPVMKDSSLVKDFFQNVSRQDQMKNKSISGINYIQSPYGDILCFPNDIGSTYREILTLVCDILSPPEGILSPSGNMLSPFSDILNTFADIKNPPATILNTFCGI